MGSRNRSRRDVLKTGATVASIGVLGSLSGCSSLQSGDEETPDEESDGSSRSVADDVPSRADFVMSLDFETLLNDEALRGAVNDGLSESQTDGESIPSSVEEALNRIEEETDVDPRQLNEAAMFAEASADPESPYGGYLAYTGWAGELIRGRIEDLREETEEEKVETEEYGGKEIYVLETDEGTARLVVFEDGTIALGAGGAVEDVIDIRNGDAEAVSGELADAWSATRDGYLDFAVDVDAEDVPEESREEMPPALESVRYSYGSVYPDGDVRGIEFNLETESESAAEEVKSLVEEGFDRAIERIRDADREGAEDVVAFIEDTTVTAEATTVTVRNEVAVDEITPVVREFVRRLVTFYTEHGSNYGPGMDYT